MDRTLSIGPQPEPAKAVQPRQGPLRHPAIDPQATARFGPTPCQVGINPPRLQLLAMRL